MSPGDLIFFSSPVVMGAGGRMLSQKWRRDGVGTRY